MNLFPSSLATIARNSFATMIIRGSFGLARIVVLMTLAKIYGAYEFGLFSLALTFMEITKVVADIGVDVVSIRRFASDPANAHSMLESIIGLKIISSIIGTALALIVFNCMYNDMRGLQLLSIACLSILTSLIINAFVSYYQTQLSMSKLIKAHFWGIGFYFIFSIFAIAEKLPIIVLMSLIPLCEGITLFKLIQQHTQIQKLKVKYDFAFIRSLISESIYVGIAGIIVVIYLRLDTVMISRLLNVVSVGHYALAYRLTEPFSLIFTSFGVSLYASLSSLPIQATVTNRFSMAKKTMVLMITLACTALVCFLFIVRPILPWFSMDYIDSGNVLVILGFVLVFKAINTQTVAVLNSMEKFRIVSVITCSNLGISFALNILLIPLYGIQGAAMAAVGTELMNTILQLGSIWYYHKQQISSKTNFA